MKRIKFAGIDGKLIKLHKVGMKSEISPWDIKSSINFGERCQLYYSLGYYDAVEVLDPPLLSDEEKRLRCTSGNIHEMLLRFKKTCSPQSYAGNGVGYSSQCIYALADSGDAYIDGKPSSVEEFWKVNNKALFFITLIHLNACADIKSGDKLLKKFTEGDNKPDCALYYAFDCSDIILFTKSSSYLSVSQSLKAVQDLRKLVQYSYSICSLSPDLYSQDVYTLRNTWKKEKLDQVIFRFIIKDFSKINKFVEDLSFKLCGEKYLPFYQLGSEDAYVIVNSVDIDAFTNLFNPKEGILVPVNSDYRQTLYSVHTCIGDSQKFEYAGAPEEIPNNEEQLIDRLNKIFKDNKYKCECIEKFGHLALALTEIYSAISLLDKSEFAYEAIGMVKPAAEQFLKMLERLDHDQLNELLGDGSSLKTFINQMFTILEGTMHSDRLLSYSPGFNAIIYDVPAKLGHAYTCFLHNLERDIWEKEGINNKNYKFLLTPGISIRTTNREILRPEDRIDCILTVDLPFHMLFDPELLQIQLSHELIHYVGIKTRNHEKRIHYMTVLLAIVLCYNLIEEGPIPLDVVNLVQSKIEEKLKYYNPNNSADPLERHRSITEINVLGNILHMLISDDFFIDQFISAANKVDNEKTYEQYHFAKRLEIINTISEKSKNIKASALKLIIQHHENEDSVYQIVLSVYEILREVFADIVMLYILGVNIDTYVKSAVLGYGDHYCLTEDDIVNETGLRFIFVSYTMYKNQIDGFTEIQSAFVDDRLSQREKNMIKMKNLIADSIEKIDEGVSIFKYNEEYYKYVLKYAQTCFDDIISTYASLREKYSTKYKAMVENSGSEGKQLSVKEFFSKVICGDEKQVIRQVSGVS